MNIPRLVNAIGMIDEELYSQAIKEKTPAQNKKKTYLPGKLYESRKSAHSEPQDKKRF